ncbi:MAG: cation-translocating P-type ATPase [Verrucomicrobiota bacterium]
MTELPDVKSASASKGASGFLIGGMTCNNCVRHVREAVQAVPGVVSAEVDLQTRRAAVRWKPDAAPDNLAIVTAIKAAGYQAKPLDPGQPAAAGLGGWELALWVGVLGTLPLMLGEWVFGLAMTPWFQWVAFALASVVQVIAGAPFYRGAWNQLRVGSSNMDTLVVLGSTTAFGYSAWTLFSGHGGHVFFMESASIITLISVGHWMEARVSRRASGALRELMQLAPRMARRIQRTGGDRPKAPMQPFNLKSLSFSATPTSKPPTAAEEEVPVAELMSGDWVALRPGDHVPTDGEVVEGHSAVDEAMLTGESVPVDKSPKSQLFAGTINLNGRLVMRVTATGEETALAHIIAAVQRAQTSRANIQRIGDRVSNVFVPIVVTIALLAGLWWGLAPESAAHVHARIAAFIPWHLQPFDHELAAAFIIAASVLIIACPCAMGLATPAAIMASANAAARRGILIRDGVALEKAGQITAVVFDKTGTLTTGKPEAVKVWTLESGAETKPIPAEPASDSATVMAASLARHSNHPISQAIAKLATTDTSLKDWQEVRGSGVEAKLSSAQTSIVRLGSLRWLRECGVAMKSADAFVTDWSGRGATVVGFAVERELRAVFAVKDVIKSGAPGVVGQLQRQGLKVFLVTGDQAATAAGIAGQLGIPPGNVVAEVRPEQKAEFIKGLQARGERLAFVGDGINDAPALTQADLGIAVSRASDVAREAADIILLKSEIEAVPESLGLARATLRTIKQNLFWAFFYNALGVPLAALGFMSPVLCAAAMGVSDIIVIGNALRLSRWRR